MWPNNPQQKHGIAIEHEARLTLHCVRTCVPDPSKRSIGKLFVFEKNGKEGKSSKLDSLAKKTVISAEK